MFESLKNLLKNDERLVSDGKLLKNKIVELGLKLDEELIKLLLTNERIKEYFFKDIDGVLVFDKEKFVKFIDNKEFLPDSYTSFKNKIGLAVDGNYIAKSKEVALVWPYKDCILEGGQEKPDEKRREIVYNEILAPDEIDRLLDPKVFTNFKRIDKAGEHEAAEIKPTDNLIIKGNNLLVLHSLKKKFAGKVKLIYIDPPYNTGNDEFKYNDNFNHSTWLTFMKNRLEVAKELLREDGVIFISVDDNEQAYLRVLCDEIFGKENYLNTFCWVSNLKGRQISSSGAVKTYEYVLVFVKKIENIGLFEMSIKKLKSLMPSSYKGFGYETESDGMGDFVVKNELYNTNSAFNEETRPNLVFNIHYNFKTKEVRFSDTDEDKNFDGFVKIPPKKNNDGIHLYHAWRWSKKKIANEISGLKFVKTDKGVKIFTKIREFSSTNLKDIITDIPTTLGSSDIKRLFDGVKHFNYPKPVELIKIFVEQTRKEDIVLDFFSGSGTTAQAVLELNKEDGGNRQFILCEQLDYVDTITIPRVEKVIRKIGGGDFVYCELMKLNEDYIEQIQGAKDSKALLSIWEEMKINGFLSYRLDPKLFDENIEEFKELPIAEQKRLLLETLDKNYLYVNYSEIDDEMYKVKDEDKKLNKKFYGGNKDGNV